MSSPSAACGRFLVAALQEDGVLPNAYGALGEKRVYEGQASGELPEYPLVTFQNTAEGGVAHKIGNAGWFKAEPVYVVRVFASAEDELDEGVEGVILALDGAHGTAVGLSISCRFTGEKATTPEEPGSGETVYGKSLTFRFYVTR